MPQEPIETVEIEDPDNPGEKLIINRVDFDPDKHKLYAEPEAPADMASESGESEEGDGKPEDAEEPKPDDMSGYTRSEQDK